MTPTRIIVIAERTGDEVRPVTREVLACARELAADTGGRVEMLVAGSRIGGVARELARTCAVTVTGLESRRLALYNGEAYRNALLQVLDAGGPFLVCLPHTAFGADLAPRLAAALDAACITAVEETRRVERRIHFVRPMFGGKLRAEIVSDRPGTVVTIAPGAWPEADCRRDSEARWRVVDVDVASGASRTREVVAAAGQRLNLNDAEVIVAAGRGIRDPKNLRLLEDLAAIFPRSGLACSRAVCDLGWLGYAHQVGVTGQTVSPGLYIACGISGAVQHLAGMKGSRVVVAINSDPHAAIFQVADYCVVEDLERFIPLLLEEFGRSLQADTAKSRRVAKP